MSNTEWTAQDAAELARLEGVFERTGGRVGMSAAARIDALRNRKRDLGTVKVRFSEVHWFEVTVPWAELAEANGGDVNVAGLAGAVDDQDGIPEAVNDLLDAAVSEAGAMSCTTEVDGREIHAVRRVDG